MFLFQVYTDLLKKDRDGSQSFSQTKISLQKEILSRVIKNINNDEDIKSLLKKIGKKPKASSRTQHQLLNACHKNAVNCKLLFAYFETSLTPGGDSPPATPAPVPSVPAQRARQTTRPAAQPVQQMDPSAPSQPSAGSVGLVHRDQPLDSDPVGPHLTTAGPAHVMQDTEDDTLREEVSHSEARHVTAMLRTLSEDQLENYYKRFGGRSSSPRHGDMIKFVKNNATTKMLDKIPLECMKGILSEYGIPYKRAQTVKSILRHEAVNKAEILRTAQDTFDLIEEGVCVNNFFPYRFNQLTENQEKVETFRQKRIKSINDNEYYYDPDNPILEKGRVIEEKMEEFKMDYCSICEEQWFSMNVNETTKMCERCTKLRKPNIPDMYSKENNMIPGPQPPCFHDISLVDTLAFCCRRGVMKVIKLRGGGTRLVGHAVTVGQDVGEWIVKELPRPPCDIPIVLLKSPHQTVPFTASRWKIRQCIEFLIRNNPVYKDCVLNMANLNLYPEDNGPVEGLNIIEQEAPAFDEEEPPNVAAAEETDGVGEEHHGEEVNTSHGLYESGIGVEMPGQTNEQQVMSALQTLFTDEVQARESGAAGTTDDNNQPQDAVNPPTINWPRQLPGLISEFEENFFVLCYPHLFPHGTGDISSPRLGETPKRLLDWLNHLCRLKEPDGRPNRFASDPRFLFHVINIYQRRQGQTLAAVFVDKVLEVTNFAEVKEKLLDPSSNYSKCFASMSSQIKGGSTYFYSKRREALAFEKFIRIQSGNTERFNLFLTLSLADGHMAQLHTQLPGSSAYLGKTVVEDATGMDPNLFISKGTDARLRQEALAKSGNIVDAFVTHKLQLLKKEVLQEYCGVLDWIIRSEYQARSALHWHIVARVQGIELEVLEEAFSRHFVVSEERKLIGGRDCPTEEAFQEKLAKARQNGVTIVQEEDEERYHFIQEKVIDFAATTLGLSAVHPEMEWEAWPEPFGNNDQPPANNPLRVELRDVEDQHTHYTDLCNRVQLHTCRPNYCFSPDDPPERRRCRHGFPKHRYGFSCEENVEDPENVVRSIKRSEIDETEHGAGIADCDLHLLRNHTNFVQHIPEILSIWQANTDAKLIKSVPTLIEYVIKVSFPFVIFLGFFSYKPLLCFC